METTPTMKYVTLFTGAKMPALGYGTFLSKDTKELVLKAVNEAGYRHIDTAAIYKNEDQVGEALHEILSAGHVKREDLFITTKLWIDKKDKVEEALKESLQRLQLDYVDMYLIHWSTPYRPEDSKSKEFVKVPLHVTWKQMEDCVKKGLTKHIGVSNFNVQLITDLLSYCEIQPATNQVELNPYLTQTDLIEFLGWYNIVPTAYSPLGAPGFEGRPQEGIKNLLEDEVVGELAKKYNKTPAQIILNWGIQRGHVVIPKASSVERMRQNIGAAGFDLAKEDVEKLTKINRDQRSFNPKNWEQHLKLPLFN